MKIGTLAAVTLATWLGVAMADGTEQPPPPSFAPLGGTSRLLPGDVVDAIQLAQDGGTDSNSSGSRSSGGSSGGGSGEVGPDLDEINGIEPVESADHDE